MNIYIPSSYISFYYIVNSSHLCVNKHLVDFQLFFYLCILAVICAYSQPFARTRSHLRVLAVVFFFILTIIIFFLFFHFSTFFKKFESMDYKCVDKDCKFLDQANKHQRKCGCGKTLVNFCEYCETNISSSNFSKHLHSYKNKRRKIEDKTSTSSQECLESIEELKKVNFNFKLIIDNTRKVKIIWVKRNKQYDNRFILPPHFEIPKTLEKDIIYESDLEIALEEYK